MKRTLMFTVVMVLAISVNAEAAVIAGSTGGSPPPFWENSYSGFSTAVEHAFSFSLDLAGQYSLDSLEVAVFRNASIPSAAASFTIRPDVAGLPGETVLDTFNVSNISITQQVMTSDASQQAVLSSGSTYWIVGIATQVAVRWNLSAGGFGPRATRVDDGDWTYYDRTNVCAFAIHGTAVPEPVTMGLFCIGALLLRRKAMNNE